MSEYITLANIKTIVLLIIAVIGFYLEIKRRGWKKVLIDMMTKIQEAKVDEEHPANDASIEIAEVIKAHFTIEHPDADIRKTARIINNVYKEKVKPAVKNGNGNGNVASELSEKKSEESGTD